MSQEENFKSKPKKMPLTTKLAVGAMAGVVGTSFIFPIDMVKTRLQASKGVYTGPIHCLKTIIKIEGGVRALYRGLVPNLIGVTPEKAIKLAANEYFCEMLERPDGSISFSHQLMAGAGAGFCQVIATNPMELTKIRMQMNAMLPPAERLTLGQVVSKLGIRGMYTGTTATLMRDVPFSLIFFPMYSNLSKAFSDSNGHTSLINTLIAGGVAGAIASGTVTPADVVKTRLQLDGGKAKYGNMFNAYKTIIREEGFGALYKGAVPRMAVVGPLFAITLLSFEAQKAFMSKNIA